MISKVQITDSEVLRRQACKTLSVTKPHDIRGKFKVRHRIFLLLKWRTGGRDELVQVDSVSNPSGSSNEGLHERLEVMLLGIGHPDGRQLVLSHILAVNTYQGQSNISTTPGGRLLPLLHSTWNFIQSSH